MNDVRCVCLHARGPNLLTTHAWRAVRSTAPRGLTVIYSRPSSLGAAALHTARRRSQFPAGAPHTLTPHRRFSWYHSSLALVGPYRKEVGPRKRTSLVALSSLAWPAAAGRETTRESTSLGLSSLACPRHRCGEAPSRRCGQDRPQRHLDLGEISTGSRRDLSRP